MRTPKGHGFKKAVYTYNHIDTIKEEDKLEQTFSPVVRVNRVIRDREIEKSLAADIGSTGAVLRQPPLIQMEGQF